MIKNLYILGTRGIPAKHGGFETFVEKLSLYLINKGWKVTVYCQCSKRKKQKYTKWKKINLVNIYTKKNTSFSTILFDLRSILHSSNKNGLFLILGYNTAIFNSILKFKKKTTLINMDGIEWRRDKWNFLIKLWFYLNEYLAIKFNDFYIADNPHIKKYLTSKYKIKNINMIPYGSDTEYKKNEKILKKFDLKKKKYSILIARPEPENSIFLIIKTFAKFKRNHKLLILGSYDFKNNPYHKKIFRVANEEIIFAGSIYDKNTVDTLRDNSLFYIHGHKVGGTNPALVEAMSKNCHIIAYNNLYNRWVLNNNGFYFKNEKSLENCFQVIFKKNKKISNIKKKIQKRFFNNFKWKQVLIQYENLLNNKYKLVKF